MTTERLEQIRKTNGTKANGHIDSAVQHVRELLAHIDDRGWASPDSGSYKETEVSRAAAVLSREGASKGGEARARSLSPEQRSLIAQRAAEARWGKRSTR